MNGLLIKEGKINNGEIMKFASWSVCLFILISATSASAQSKTKKQFYPDTIVRHKMNTISGTIRELGPYIASEQEFVKENNKKYIEKNLKELTELFKNLKAHPVIATQGLSMNQAVMTQQLQQTVTLFQSEKKQTTSHQQLEHPNVFHQFHHRPSGGNAGRCQK